MYGDVGVGLTVYWLRMFVKLIAINMNITTK